ncbi:hypothetical protein DFH09DRAFT_1279280 [Mycena vulgaris]|nr:hypothetical protein DFH09DRAFT_1279280 [Mycena vulgaris]
MNVHECTRNKEQGSTCPAHHPPEQGLRVHEETIPVEDFFDWILNISRDWRDEYVSDIHSIQSDAKFKSCLHACHLNVVKETHLYHPFPELANHCLEKLGGGNFQLENKSKLTLGKTLFQSHGLIGRGTCWSWLADSRTPEAEILQKATRLAQGSHSWVLDHLPKILWSEERRFEAESPQCRLFEHLGADKYELKAPKDYAEALQGIFKCYRWLYEIPRIMHRDISLNNLMVRMKDGRIYGVLDDFDLLLILDTPSPSTSKQRTGTRPYMALDLLVPGPPPPHISRFDLESLFYVVLFLTCHSHEGSLEQWKHIGTEALYKKKVTFFYQKCPPPTPGFLPLHRWTQRLHTMFADGYAARSAFVRHEDIRGSGPESEPVPTFDNDTLGGHVSFDKFQAILEIN